MVPASSVPLRVRALIKQYGAVEALRGVSFEAVPGEIFGLLGPNGAGKTTTIECILGLRRPDAGEIFLGELDALARPEAAKQLLGAQIQTASLQDVITPRQALRLFAAFYRNPASVDALLAQFGLNEKANAAFSSLSGGQKQRLFLALAFVNQPRIVLLDEPTTGLDPRSRRELHQLILNLRATGCTVLLSTHALDEAQQLCDRLAIIDRGRIIAAGTAPELLARATATPRLSLRTTRPLPPALLAELPGAALLSQDGGLCRLTAPEPHAVIAALVNRLPQHGIEIVDLQVQRASLEDVFLELTGRAYSPNNDSEAEASS